MRVIDSSGGSADGGGYDAIAYQMLTDNLSVASTEAAWALADRRKVFNRLAFNLEGVILGKKTTALSFNDATDSTTIVGSPAMVSYVNNSAYLAAALNASTELIDYAQSSAPDVSTGSYASKSFSVNSQEAFPGALAFSGDGTKMYALGTTNNTVYQYTLSTAWDVSTAAYASKSFSVNSQDTGPNGLTFNLDGTKMYVVGITNDKVFQYTLSTAWDVSTATYDSKSLTVSSEDTVPLGVALSLDGTKLYIMGNAGDSVDQYTLTTAWDVSTGSYASKSFSVTSQETDPNDLAFSRDGSIMYIVGPASDAVYQYTLSTPWDVSTAVYASKSLSVSSEENAPKAVAVSGDGTKVYVLGTTNDTVYQYTTTEDAGATQQLIV